MKFQKGYKSIWPSHWVWGALFISSRTGTRIWKTLTFPFRTSEYTYGFKALNVLALGWPILKGWSTQMTGGGFHWSILPRAECHPVHWDLLPLHSCLILKRKVTELRAAQLSANPANPRGREDSASTTFPRSGCPWPALFANTTRWNRHHRRSSLYGTASRKYIGGVYVLIKHSNINMICASSHRLSSEHSQLGMRKFLWFWLNANAVNFRVTVWPMPFLPFSHLHPLPHSVPPEKIAFQVSLRGSRVSAAHRWRSDWWLAGLPPLTSSTSETALKSQSSLTAFEQRNETVSLTQRLLAWGKKFLLKKKKKKNSNTLPTTLLSIHLVVWPIHPQVRISFQTL